MNEKKLRTVLNFMDNFNYDHVIIKEAADEIGIDANELKEKSLNDFKDKQTTSEIQELRYQHYEGRRQAKIELVAQKILSNSESAKSPINKSYASTSRALNTVSLSKESEKSFSERTSERNLTVPYSPIDFANQKLETINKNLKRFLVVENNSKNLTLKSEFKRLKLLRKQRDMERRIMMEMSLSEEKRKLEIEIRDTRRKEIYEKKIMEIEQHNLKALSEDRSIPKSTSAFKNLSGSKFKTPKITE